MSNYKGGIPRLKSNERLAKLDQKEYVSQTTITSRQNNNTRVRNSINGIENPKFYKDRATDGSQLGQNMQK